MRRRRILKMLGASAASLTVGASPAAADGGVQPIQGELPNENAPHESVHAFPEENGTRETGQFLQLLNGYAFVSDCTREDQIEFFDKTRQTFVYDGRTFVLDSFEDWKSYEVEADQFAFTHTDPPKPKGKTFQVTWDTIYTADFDNPWDGNQYEEGDRHDGFPYKSSYEIVAKGRR